MRLLSCFTLLLFASFTVAADKIRIACVGDSITYGAGLENRGRDCYPSVLQKLLGDKYDVRNFGVNGATLLRKGDKPYGKEKAFADAKKFKPNVVVIKLGSNDTKPQNWKHVDEYVADYKVLVGEFRSLDSKPECFVCYPAPANKGAFGIDDGRVKELKSKIDQIGRELGLTVIDTYTPLSGNPKWFPDQVHPNAAGAKVLAETVHKALTDESKK
jgi:acyl-CoA thioesterase I